MALEKNQRERWVFVVKRTVKLEVNPKEKKLATELGFDKSLTWAPHICI